MLAGSLLHTALIAGEFVLSNHEAESRAALQALRRGPLRGWLWLGSGGVALGIALAVVSLSMAEPVAAYVAAGVVIAAIGAYEHAHVQAGQSVPLA